MKLYKAGEYERRFSANHTSYLFNKPNIIFY